MLAAYAHVHMYIQHKNLELYVVMGAYGDSGNAYFAGGPYSSMCIGDSRYAYYFTRGPYSSVCIGDSRYAYYFTRGPYSPSVLWTPGVQVSLGIIITILGDNFSRI